VASSLKNEKSVVREYTEAIIIAIILALFIRSFIVQAFKIPSGSMLSTLQIGDHLLVNKFIYGVKIPMNGGTLIPWKSPKRGDITVFRFPRDSGMEFIKKYRKDRTRESDYKTVRATSSSIDYIKRVVGISGDTVEIKNKQVYINGEAVENPHIQFTRHDIMNSSIGPRDNMGPVTVPENSIFVMGDNRDNSFDSRFWGFVPLRNVLGKAFILYWSWDLDRPLMSIDRFSSIRWNRIGDIVH
jgi:signal peptidase I